MPSIRYGSFLASTHVPASAYHLASHGAPHRVRGSLKAKELWVYSPDHYLYQNFASSVKALDVFRPINMHLFVLQYKFVMVQTCRIANEYATKTHALSTLALDDSQKPLTGKGFVGLVTTKRLRTGHCAKR